eukprot:TRINITY_DN229_c0_g1_i6.p1 TRINITY_DN229_c0_g1~~TRINITY_DN229_c0_g1_i6.p1  ORF type:complete len:547 (+),score=87.73 TRINITY_DN229_c0_g1_i6:164-1804(+)
MSGSQTPLKLPQLTATGSCAGIAQQRQKEDEVLSLNNRGVTAGSNGDLPIAWELLKEAENIIENEICGDMRIRLMAITKNNLGYVAKLDNRLGIAAKCVEAALRLEYQLGPPLPSTALNLAAILNSKQLHNKARDLAKLTIELLTDNEKLDKREAKVQNTQHIRSPSQTLIWIAAWHNLAVAQLHSTTRPLPVGVVWGYFESAIKLSTSSLGKNHHVTLEVQNSYHNAKRSWEMTKMAQQTKDKSMFHHTPQVPLTPPPKRRPRRGKKSTMQTSSSSSPPVPIAPPTMPGKVGTVVVSPRRKLLDLSGSKTDSVWSPPKKNRSSPVQHKRITALEAQLLKKDRELIEIKEKLLEKEKEMFLQGKEDVLDAACTSSQSPDTPALTPVAPAEEKHVSLTAVEAHVDEGDETTCGYTETSSLPPVSEGTPPDPFAGHSFSCLEALCGTLQGDCASLQFLGSIVNVCDEVSDKEVHYSQPMAGSLRLLRSAALNSDPTGNIDLALEVAAQNVHEEDSLQSPYYGIAALASCCQKEDDFRALNVVTQSVMV